MKKIILSVALLGFSAIFSQAFDGYADNKTSIGGSFQKGATGIVFNFDRGINDYLSYGTSFGLTISSDPPKQVVTILNDEPYIKKYEDKDLFLERVDFNLRLNGHFGKLIGLGEMADVFAGGNISFRTFGAQIGARYLVSDSFGFFAEANVPITKFTGASLYNESNSDVKSENILPYYEQPVFGVGIIISN
jgi:hypothetical protein